MKNNTRIFLAIASLALAALACQAITGAPTSNEANENEPVDTSVPESTDAPLPTQTKAPVNTPEVILDDDFSAGRNQWGTGTDADSAVEYVNDALNFSITKDLLFVWSTPDAEDYENIHIEVTAVNNSTDAIAAFGIMCNLQITNTYYYFAITSAGEYGIGIATLTDDSVLTNNGEWVESDLIAQDAPSYRIGADCGNGILTLYVDGRQIDSVSDATYPNGGVGVFAWSGEELSGTDVTFDDFIMTTLAQK